MYKRQDLIKLEELTHDYVYEGKENKEEEEDTLGFEFTNEETKETNEMNDDEIDQI